MIKINLVCVGNLKENYLIEAFNEYKKRLSKFCSFNLIELNECKPKDKINDSEIKIIKDYEGKEIISKLKGYIIGLYIKGKECTSEEFSALLKNTSLKSSEITFVIGGSYGLSDEVEKYINYKLSFSSLTFPHQLMRVILMEQIYRAFTIINNMTYHK
jgi:23S rRNA (pseudouridine1915-N3)-methyltransferase